MYLNYYKLRKEPFNITPDPDMLFLSPSHKEALAAVIYGVRQRKGFVSIVGEVGVGKTTILRSCLGKIDKEKIRTIYLFNPKISFTTLVKMIYESIAAKPISDDLFEMVNRLHLLLIEEYKAGRNVVLIIDEVQNMPVETLENLRMLSNLETSTDKLIQIIFSGQPEFEEKLNTHSLRQLKQRIALRVYIKPFTRNESLDYIAHRLAKTAENGGELFNRGALNLIVANAGGIPRVINILCDNCLITAFGRQEKQVSSAIAREVLADFDMGNRSGGGFVRNIAAAACILVLCAVGGYLAYTGSLSDASPVVPVSQSATAQVEEARFAPVQAGSVATAVRQAEPTRVEGARDENATVSRVVKKGDTLAGLVKNTYGYADHRLMKQVLQRNPGIANVNVIREGERIIFPSRDK